MGHKFFSVKVNNKPSEQHPFGALVSLGWGEFASVHTSMAPFRHCTHCGKHIDYGQAYLRLHMIRCPDAGNQPIVDQRCLACVNIGFLPSAIKMIAIIERPHPDGTELVLAEWKP